MAYFILKVVKYCDLVSSGLKKNLDTFDHMGRVEVRGVTGQGNQINEAIFEAECPMFGLRN